MTENRYDLRKELDGTWTVFDIFRGMPALVNGVEQVAWRWNKPTISSTC